MVENDLQLQEATKLSKKGAPLVEYAGNPTLICNPCLKRIADGEQDVHCSAFKPFTACSNCPNNNAGCNFAELQKFHVISTVTGVSSSTSSA